MTNEAIYTDVALWEGRFWEKVEKRGQDDCWIWKGKIGPKGYGRFASVDVGTGSKGHHVFALLTVDGYRPPAPDNHALHSCDNPTCCNPKHLTWGSNKQNMKERDERRPYKRNPRKGAAAANSRLTEERAREVKFGKLTPSEYARLFNVAPETTRLIRVGKNWKHLSA